MRRIFFIIKKSHSRRRVVFILPHWSWRQRVNVRWEWKIVAEGLSLARRGCSTRLNDYTKNIFWWFPRCVSLTTPPLSYYRQITFNSDAFFFPLVHAFLWQNDCEFLSSKLIASLSYSCSISWMSYVRVPVDRGWAIFAVATIDGLAEVARL